MESTPRMLEPGRCRIVGLEGRGAADVVPDPAENRTVGALLFMVRGSANNEEKKRPTRLTRSKIFSCAYLRENERFVATVPSELTNTMVCSCGVFSSIEKRAYRDEKNVPIRFALRVSRFRRRFFTRIEENQFTVLKVKCLRAPTQRVQRHVDGLAKALGAHRASHDSFVVVRRPTSGLLLHRRSIVSESRRRANVVNHRRQLIRRASPRPRRRPRGPCGDGRLAFGFCARHALILSLNQLVEAVKRCGNCRLIHPFNVR